VLELRYGLGGEHPRTLDEVGRTFNVTRKRTRQIENHSLMKRQKLHEAEKLRDDVEIASGFPLRMLAHRTHSTCGSDRPC
jgi:sigma-70-like protein